MARLARLMPLPALAPVDIERRFAGRAKVSHVLRPAAAPEPALAAGRLGGVAGSAERVVELS
jgi:hypothetical protein